MARAALAELEEAGAQYGTIAILASASVARGALALAEDRPAMQSCRCARGGGYGASWRHDSTEPRPGLYWVTRTRGPVTKRRHVWSWKALGDPC